MEKVNIKFNNNGTVTYQHKKILEFMPHLSVIKNDEIKLTVPNIPLLVSFAWFINMKLKIEKLKISYSRL
jgi:hypothetical protein